MNGDGLVIDDKILIAAATLPSEGFTAEELIVAVFKKFPQDFSLMGFSQYPDSNKVLTQITTAGRGLQKRGWLRKIGTKRYQMTGEGLRRLQTLKAPETLDAARPANRDIAALVVHWLRSDAYAKVRAGKGDVVSEREALAFWRLTSGSTAARTNNALAIADSAARLLEEANQHGMPTQIHHSHSIAPDEAQALLKAHRFLRNKFSDPLDYLQTQRR